MNYFVISPSKKPNCFIIFSPLFTTLFSPRRFDEPSSWNGERLFSFVFIQLQRSYKYLEPPPFSPLQYWLGTVPNWKGLLWTFRVHASKYEKQCYMPFMHNWNLIEMPMLDKARSKRSIFTMLHLYIDFLSILIYKYRFFLC